MIKKDITFGNRYNYNKPVVKFIPKIVDFLGYVPYDVSSLTLGERIKIARQSLGMTGRELAKKLGIHPDTLYGWERDEHNPTKKSRERLEEFIISYFIKIDQI